jgi:hypothetical protein
MGERRREKWVRRDVFQARWRQCTLQLNVNCSPYARTPCELQPLRAQAQGGADDALKGEKGVST